MDGLKGRLNQSVQFRLSFWLSVAILVVAMAGAGFSFLAAFDEAHELQDDTLRQIAALVGQNPAGGHFGEVAPGDDEEDARVVIRRLDGQGDGPLRSLPVDLSDGLHTVVVGGDSYRVLIRTTVSHGRIAVAQRTSVRDEAARDGAQRTLVPFLILVLILLPVVAHLVRRMFRPLTALSTEIDGRDERALHPIEEGHLPREIRPFVVAINRLLGRVAQSMDDQRRFVADAAHELRSPLTALSLQAERLAEADMSDAARDRLTTLRRGIERGRALVGQLLTLARVQAAPTRSEAPVQVLDVYRQVLEDLMPLADAKMIDVGVEEGPDARLTVSRVDLMTLVRNLVDNAIRYTPDGGRVDLSVGRMVGGVTLRVTDSGPGIPLAERHRVFDPFHRVLGGDRMGAGLGLAIVKAIADRIGAEIRLDHADAVTRSGLCVSVLIPSIEPVAGKPAVRST